MSWPRLLLGLNTRPPRGRAPCWPVVAAALALAGCGLTPVYGPGGAATRLHGQVRAADPGSADDFAFLRRIQDRLGPDGARYDLDYALTVAVLPQAITPDQVTTRYSLNGTASYALTDSGTGATVAKGQVNSFTSYSAIGTIIATGAAERDARDRLATMLADQVVTRLLAAAP